MAINVVCILITIICFLKSMGVYLWYEDAKRKGLAWSQNKEYVWDKCKAKINFYSVIAFVAFIVLIINNN